MRLYTVKNWVLQNGMHFYKDSNCVILGADKDDNYLVYCTVNLKCPSASTYRVTRAVSRFMHSPNPKCHNLHKGCLVVDEKNFPEIDKNGFILKADLDLDITIFQNVSFCVYRLTKENKIAENSILVRVMFGVFVPETKKASEWDQGSVFWVVSGNPRLIIGRAGFCRQGYGSAPSIFFRDIIFLMRRGDALSFFVPYSKNRIVMFDDSVKIL